MAYLKLDKVQKIYNKKVEAVKAIDLEVNKGEFLVLLGPSGCGKTTTMRMIAGLEEITNGEVTIEGKRINELSPKDREVSMIFQSYAVWPHMTVYDNIAYALKLKKLSKNEIDKIVKDVAEKATITDYLDRYPSQLSGGQRQRVAVARAIAIKPKLFLMDEPLSNLDAKLRDSMRTELKKIHKDLNTTSIFVTHDQAEAMSLADRIVVMNMGEIEQIGTPYEVYYESDSLFVANFIGTPPTNFIDVEVKVNGDQVTIHNQVFDYNIDEADLANSLKAYDGKTVTLGIRPEHLEIVEDNAMITTKIDIIEPQGSHSIILAQIAGIDMRVVTNSHTLKLDDTIQLRFDKQHCRYFNKESGKRIK